jgi:protein-S-isoprenylcysteine O-methyltransferase Ste14
MSLTAGGGVKRPEINLSKMYEVKKQAMKEETIDFIKQIVIDLLAALLTSSVFFSGSSRLITGYWMRWVRTPYIYIWAVLVIWVLAWIIRKRYQNKKNKMSDT